MTLHLLVDVRKSIVRTYGTSAKIKTRRVVYVEKQSSHVIIENSVLTWRCAADKTEPAGTG